jgi:putative N-acetylmannosamine-6-phosphate epimerase
MKIAQIEYRNAPDQPVNITLHVNTVQRLPCGSMQVVAVDAFDNLASKAEAMACARAFHAVLA